MLLTKAGYVNATRCPTFTSARARQANLKPPTPDRYPAMQLRCPLSLSRLSFLSSVTRLDCYRELTLYLINFYNYRVKILLPPDPMLVFEFSAQKGRPPSYNSDLATVPALPNHTMKSPRHTGTHSGCYTSCSLQRIGRTSCSTCPKASPACSHPNSRVSSSTGACRSPRTISNRPPCRL
jgi:hypothetical protein